VGGSIGNLVEWYDWYVYSAFSLYFAKAFFPPASQTAQLLNTAAVFAVGFFMRPVGGWLLGRYADKHGRRAALSASVLLMCGGSLLIACAPTYASAGVLSPVLLVLARLLQGISVGGEYGASATYLIEMAGTGRRGFWSSFQYVTLIGGQLLALAVLLVLQRYLAPEALDAWGWRVPFLIGAACAVVALRMRSSLMESHDFHAAKQAEATQLTG
jgi:MHS family alpha-ketoglutarate permease-like MFS transporter